MTLLLLATQPGAGLQGEARPSPRAKSSVARSLSHGLGASGRLWLAREVPVWH